MTKERSADVASVVAVLAGFALAVGLALGAFLVSLCGLFGAQCTATEQQQFQLLLLGSIGVFLAVPVVVSIVRRQARWLLAPLIEAFVVVALIAAADWF